MPGANIGRILNPLGLTLLDKVVPGTYRLSAYVLGEWGELRLDNVNVAAHKPDNPAVEIYSGKLRSGAAHLDHRHARPLFSRIPARRDH